MGHPSQDWMVRHRAIDWFKSIKPMILWKQSTVPFGQFA
jgi:hypothetical protein